MGLGNWGRGFFPTRFLPSHWGGIGTLLGDSPLIGGSGTPLGDSLHSREGKFSPLKMLPSLLRIASVSGKSAKSEAANVFIKGSKVSLFGT